MSAWLPWVLLPCVGALIGYATNWLAIRMLFHPRRKRFGVQGLLPRRQADLADSVGRVVAEELLAPERVLAQLDDVDLRPAFERLAVSALERKAKDLRKIPLVGGFITDDRLKGISDTLVDELVKAQPRIIEELKRLAHERIDIHQLVRDRLEQFDLDELERVVHRVASHEFRAIEWWGALLGAIIGCAQAGLLALLA